MLLALRQLTVLQKTQIQYDVTIEYDVTMYEKRDNITTNRCVKFDAERSLGLRRSSRRLNCLKATKSNKIRHTQALNYMYQCSSNTDAKHNDRVKMSGLPESERDATLVLWLPIKLTIFV